MMAVMVTTGDVRRVKLQIKCHHQRTDTQFLPAACPSHHPTNSVKAQKLYNISVNLCIKMLKRNRLDMQSQTAI